MASVYNVIISELAETDLDEIMDWYASKGTTLLNQFTDHLDKSLSSIQNFPFSFPEGYKNIRKYFMTKFPYTIFYRMLENEIEILAVVHMSRNPEYWKERFEFIGE